MGPPAPVMSVLGDKIAANILAQTAKVPSIPWSGSFGNPGDDGPLQANLQEDGTIPRETFEAGCVHSAEEALAAAERVQYPVMLKASEGGGGKGIRMCKNAEELSAAFPQVENEQPGLDQRPFHDAATPSPRPRLVTRRRHRFSHLRHAAHDRRETSRSASCGR